MDPVPLTIFVEAIYRGLYRHTTSLDTRAGLKRQADEFSQIATDIMDLGIRETPERARTFFQRGLFDFNQKSAAELAYDARNK